VGVLIKPSDSFQIGGRYQQKVDLELKGKNTYGFSIITMYDFEPPEPTPIPGTGKPEFYSLQKVIFSLPLPSEFVVGFMVTPTQKYSIQFDIQRTGWSSFQMWEFVAENPEDSYFPEPVEEDMNDEPVEGAKEGIALDMKDTWSFQLGGECYLKDELTVRIGYARHQSPLEVKNLTPVLPLLSRNVFSFGVGYDGPARSVADQSLIGNLTFDAFMQYVKLDEQTSSYPGYPLTVGGHYWVFGFGVGLYL